MFDSEILKYPISIRYYEYAHFGQKLDGFITRTYESTGKVESKIYRLKRKFSMVQRAI